MDDVDNASLAKDIIDALEPLAFEAIQGMEKHMGSKVDADVRHMLVAMYEQGYQHATIASLGGTNPMISLRNSHLKKSRSAR